MKGRKLYVEQMSEIQGISNDMASGRRDGNRTENLCPIIRDMGGTLYISFENL